MTSEPNEYSERWSQLVKDPLFSPLSAMSDSELRALPMVYVVGATRDLLRDDAKMLAARLAAVDRLAVYHEFDHYHVSFFFAFFGSERSKEVFEELVAMLEGGAVL